jgi:hypothetical protein
MIRAVATLPSLYEVIFRPATAWGPLLAVDPPWTTPLLRVALPLSVLPAFAWPIGQAASGDASWAPGAMAGSFVSTAVFAIATILLLAAGFYVLAGFFDLQRQWGRSVALAAYASSPVLLSGALLVMPVLVIACLVACLHCFALCYLGAQRLLGCSESDAAFYVAAAWMFMLVSSMLAAGLCSAAGLI